MQPQTPNSPSAAAQPTFPHLRGGHQARADVSRTCHARVLPAVLLATTTPTITRDQILLVGGEEVARTPRISLLPGVSRLRELRTADAPLPHGKLEGQEVAGSHELLCRQLY